MAAIESAAMAMTVGHGARRRWLAALAVAVTIGFVLLAADGRAGSAVASGTNLFPVSATHTADANVAAQKHVDVEALKRSAPEIADGHTPPPEPSDYRMDAYRKPVPATLAGARVISGDEAIKLWHEKTAVFIDVFPRAPKPPNLPQGTIWRDHPHQTIENAHWLPNVGYGKLAPQVDADFRRHLEELTDGDTARALVFFCLRNCWMSWNAAKRALSYGYQTVIWFPDGTDAWQELGQLVVDAQPRPLSMSTRPR